MHSNPLHVMANIQKIPNKTPTVPTEGISDQPKVPVITDEFNKQPINLEIDLERYSDSPEKPDNGLPEQNENPEFR